MAKSRAEISKEYRLRKIQETGDPDYWKKYYNKWRKDNPDSGDKEHKRKYNNERYKNKKEEINSKRKRSNLTIEKLMIERKKKRDYYETHPNANIAAIYRDRIANAIKKKGLKKNFHSYDMLGCTWDELIKYIESKFSEGMNWDNHGRGNNKWHLDHRIPCSHFNLADLNEVRKCFHYSNIQPLWETDNLRKNNELPKEYIDGLLVWTDENGWILNTLFTNSFIMIEVGSFKNNKGWVN